MDAAWSSRCGVTTDERAEPDNADEIQTEVFQEPQQEAASASREATAGRASARDEGARPLRRVLQLEPPGVRRRPLELLVPHGGPGHGRHGAGEGVLVRVARGSLSLAREPGAAAPLPDAREVRQVRAVRRGHRVRPPRRPPDRKSTRLNSSHLVISYAVFCLKKKTVHDTTEEKTSTSIFWLRTDEPPLP